MAEYTYQVRGLPSPDSAARIHHELLSLRDIQKATWTAGSILWIKTDGGDPLPFVLALCRQEKAHSVTRVPGIYRFFPLYCWLAGLLLWLLGWLLPLPYWAGWIFFALAAAIAGLPLLAGTTSWKQRSWGSPVVLAAWLILSFFSGNAQDGALAVLLFSVGMILWDYFAGRFNRYIPPLPVRDKTKQPAIRAAHLYMLAAISVAVIVGILVPLIGNKSWATWLGRACTILIMAQAGLWPVTVVLHLRAGRQAAARYGCICKQPEKIETLAKAQSVVVDKQGTLTKEPLRVVSLHTLPDVSADMCVGLAALLESHADHPVARAIIAHAAQLQITAGQGIGDAIQDIEILPSMGVTAHMEDHVLLCGNRQLLESYDLVAENLPEGEVYLAIDDRVIASFGIAGRLRRDAAQAVSDLKVLGIDSISLLTGDPPTPAEKTAVQVGIENVYAGLLPESKLSALRKIQRSHPPTLFIGCGIYDIPTLLQADAGITLPSAPQEVQEAACVLLDTGELCALPRAIRECRKVLAALRWKGRAGLIIKAAAMVVAICGLLPLWGAVLTEIVLAALSAAGLSRRASGASSR